MRPIPTAGRIALAMAAMPLLAILAHVPAAEAREIKGELAYRERIALSPDAQIAIEVQSGGSIAAEQRLPTGGAQVPLPFAIEVPAGADQMLTGALIEEGRVTWISQPVPLPEGDAPVDLGLLPLTRFVARGFPSQLDCGGQQAVVGFAGADQAVLTLGTETFVLTQTENADVDDGRSRFSDRADPETAIHLRDDSATITLKGATLPDCIQMTNDLPLPFTARGNEPGWVLNVTAEGVALSREDGGGASGGPVATGEENEAGLRYAFGEGLSFTVQRGICHDTMTGMPYPASVLVDQAGELLQGCGGDPARLLAGDWKVTAIGTADVPAGAEVTIGFAEGRVSGRSACNRYTGTFGLTGEGLSLGPLAGTMMACPDPQMALERDFHAAMAQVDRFDIGPAGELLLIGGDVTLITAAR